MVFFRSFLDDVTEYQKARNELAAVTTEPAEAIQMAAELMKAGIRPEDINRLISVYMTGVLRLGMVDHEQLTVILDGIKRLSYAVRS